MPVEDYIDVTATEADVLARMLTLLDDSYDKSEGSRIVDFQVPTAIEVVTLADRLRVVLDWIFAPTSFGEYLTMRAAEHGVDRLGATLATGALVFTGPDGTVIPAGTTVSTETTGTEIAQVAATDVEVVIAGGTATVAATSTAAGAAGNVGANALVLLEDPGALPGVAVTNPDPFILGTDEETDAALLSRYLQRVRNPGSSGNMADYVNWALEVAGVGGAVCIPLADGPGTVTVAIVDMDKRAIPGAPLTALVEAVQDYIAPGGADTGTGKAPVGASVTIEAATEIAIAIEATLVLEDGYVAADVQAQAETIIADYLSSLAFADDNDVRLAKVVTLLVETPGVIDATGVELNGGVLNIEIDPTEVAVPGVYTWS